MRRTRIIKQDRFWDVFQKFVDKGVVIARFEETVGAKKGYIRSVKSKRRIPKYKTYKAISDTLREYQRQTPNRYNNFITNDDLDMILDPMFIRQELEDRKIKIVDLASVMSEKDHTVGERLRYWKNADHEQMTLSTIIKFETAIREYDRVKQNEVDLERENPTTWDFEGERQRYLVSGHLHELELRKARA